MRIRNVGSTERVRAGTHFDLVRAAISVGLHSLRSNGSRESSGALRLIYIAIVDATFDGLIGFVRSAKMWRGRSSLAQHFIHDEALLADKNFYRARFASNAINSGVRASFTLLVDIVCNCARGTPLTSMLAGVQSSTRMINEEARWS